MIEIDCGTCPQLGRPRSHLGLVYAGTDQAGHDGNRFQTYDCLRRLTGSRRPPFRVLGRPEVGGIGVYMHENAASHVHDNTFEQCEASQKKKRSEASMCAMPYCPRTTRQKEQVEWRGCSAKFQPHMYLHGEYRWREVQPVLFV